MQLSTLPWGEMLTTGGVGAALMKGFDWLATRGRSKAYTMGAVDHAVQTAMTLVTERLEKVEAQHGECEKNLREVRDDLAAARAEIDRLMQGEVPSYTTIRRQRGRRDA